MKNLTDFIVEIPDLIPEDELNSLLLWLETANWIPTKISNGVEDKTIRSCDNTNVWGTVYDGLLFNYVSKALMYYKDLFPDVSISKDTGYDLLRYRQGGFYTQHVDSYDINPRIISLSLTFNDDYEGGDFSFFDGEYVVKTKPGNVVMFPSNFMYPHAITPITKGTRYSMVTWFI